MVIYLYNFNILKIQVENSIYCLLNNILILVKDVNINTAYKKIF